LSKTRLVEFELYYGQMIGLAKKFPVTAYLAQIADLPVEGK